MKDKIRNVFGKFAKYKHRRAPIRARSGFIEKGQAKYRCVACPFNDHKDRPLFTDAERNQHDEVMHETEPLIAEFFTESSEFFEGVEKDAIDGGELNF